MYQALQFGLAGLPRCKVELIYGEFIPEKKNYSNARDLSQYWFLSTLTEAKNLFIRRLDGKPLAELLKPEWEEGSALIAQFSDLVECNFALDIPQWITDTKRSLARSVKGTEPEWILEIRYLLQNQIIKKIDYKYTSDILRSYARLLEYHGLIVQAIITLQAALETRTIEAFGPADDIGNYDLWQSTYKNHYLAQKDRLAITGVLFQIERMRNKIAHGGYQDKDKERYIKSRAKEIQRILKETRQAIHQYFTEVKPKE